MFGLKLGASVYVSVVLGWQCRGVATSLRGRNSVKATWKLGISPPLKARKIKIRIYKLEAFHIPI